MWAAQWAVEWAAHGNFAIQIRLLSSIEIVGRSVGSPLNCPLLNVKWKPSHKKNNGKRQGSCPLRCPWAARGQRIGLPVGCPWEFCQANKAYMETVGSSVGSSVGSPLLPNMKKNGQLNGQRSGLPMGCPWEFCHAN